MGLRVVPVRFRVVPGGSGWFRVVPAGSGRFWKVPVGSGRFRVGSTFYIHPFRVDFVLHTGFALV